MMRKLILFLLFSVVSFAQVPQKMSHRGTAYNSNGTVLTGAISIRVRILQGSSTGTPDYVETYNTNTNSSGQYNINIGEGAVVSGAFNNIDWSTGQKWLEIGIAPGTNQTNYVIGSSQLMSVPYALYAINSLNSQIKVYNNIVELRAASANLNDIVYIKGHTTAGDGGEGHFIWREIFTEAVSGNPNLNDNNGTIIRNNSLGSGWVRIIKDKINVKFFGIQFNKNFDFTPDHTAIIQKAIDYAANNALNYPISDTKTMRDYTNCGSSVYIPAGIYKIAGTLTLKYGVSIEGDGTINTVLKADNSVNPGGTMIDLDKGIVAGVNISNISFDGNVNANDIVDYDPSSISHADAKNCFYLKAKTTSYNTGGLWSSSFKNISIRNFNGSGIILEGSGLNSQLPEDYLYPNQFIVFENVNIARQRDISMCLLIRGGTGQLTFINCVFDGLLKDNKASKLFNVAIETNAVEAAAINFITCTFQYSEYGAITTYGESITFDTCWFETLDIGVAAKASINFKGSKCINILNSRFANAAGFGTMGITNKNSWGGTCIAVEGASNVNVQNNYVLTSENNNNPNNYFIKNFGLDSKINASNNSFQNPSLGKTLGIANKATDISGNSLNTFGYKFISVNTLSSTNTVNYVKEIISEISAGETITIKAIGSELSQIKFENTKNIILPKSLFILNANETATFIKVDTPINVGGITYNETYQLVTVSNDGDSNWNYVTNFNTSVTPPITSFDIESTVRYRRKNGVVYLDGKIRGGSVQTNGTAYLLFTLPLEYRPSRKMSFPTTRFNTTTTSVVGRIDIDVDGNVYGVNYSNLSNSLSNISFLVD